MSTYPHSLGNAVSDSLARSDPYLCRRLFLDLERFPIVAEQAPPPVAGLMVAARRFGGVQFHVRLAEEPLGRRDDPTAIGDGGDVLLASVHVALARRALLRVLAHLFSSLETAVLVRNKLLGPAIQA